MDPYTQPDFSSIALITIDVQRDTLDGQPFEVSGTSAILPKMQRLLQTFRRTGLPIIHMVRLYKPDGSNVELCRQELARRGSVIFRPTTPGCELAGKLLPEQQLG